MRSRPTPLRISMRSASGLRTRRTTTCPMVTPASTAGQPASCGRSTTWPEPVGPRGVAVSVPSYPVCCLRFAPSFPLSSYGSHGSLHFGEMGAALVAMRMDPAPVLADLVYAHAEANLE